MMKKIDTSKWNAFSLGELFNIVKGTRLTKANMQPGKTRFIGSSAINNGWTNSIDNNEHLHPANTITVCYNGSIGETFYQDEPFWASDDVNVFYPKFELNERIALFIIPLIKRISKRYTYTDKWKQEVMIIDKIKLPVAANGEPDWKYIDTYMEGVMLESKASLEHLRQAKKASGGG